MYKRIVPVIFVAALVVCSIVIPAAAAAGYTVLDYEDYISTYTVDSNDQAWAKILLPREYFVVKTVDRSGTAVRDPGSYWGVVSTDADSGNQMSVDAYIPGADLNHTYISLSNIPDSSKLSIESRFTVSDEGFQTDIDVAFRLGVIYYDSFYRQVGSSYSDTLHLEIGDSEINQRHYLEVDVLKPEGAAFFSYVADIDLSVTRSNDRSVDVTYYFYNPSLMVSTSVIQAIINGTVNPIKPDGSDGITDVGDLEGDIFDQTDQGRQELDVVQDKASPFVSARINGFLFFTYFFDMFASIGFFDGLLTVSLSLGAFAFLGNVGLSLGRVSSFRKGGND